MVERSPKHPPAPGEHIQVRLTTIKAGRMLHRFHMNKFQATDFNGTDKGNARFSPIRNTLGEIIPTLYGGSTFDCAGMETVFRDMTYEPPPKYYQKAKLAGFMYSNVLVVEELSVVDLSSKALRSLNITRNELIDTEKNMYPTTRLWAEAIHASVPDAQGLRWISRQDDTAEAVVLFGDRIGPTALVQHGRSLDVVNDEVAYNWLLDLAEVIGVRIVP